MGIFEILSEVTRDFWEELDELVNEFGKVVARENENVKQKDKKSDEEDYSSYECKKKDVYVNGEKVSHDEQVWKDGKCVKDEHCCKDSSIENSWNEKCIEDDGGKFKRCKCGKCEVKDDGDIEYTIEFNDENDVDWLKKKNDSLRKSVNQLCNDAKKDHEAIEALKKENDELKCMLKKITGMIGSIGQ